MKYRCWNTGCHNYAGRGVVLTNQYVTVDEAGARHCGYCGAYVEQVPEPNSPAGGVFGAAGGAAVGFAVGGPPGAIIGGILGLIVGSSGSKA